MEDKVITTCCLSQFGQTNPGSVCQSFGGVGRNIAGMFMPVALTHMFSTCSLNLNNVSQLLPLCCSSRLPESIGLQTLVHLSYRRRFTQWSSVSLLPTYGISTSTVVYHKAWLQSSLFKFVNWLFSYFCKNTSGVAKLEEQSTAIYCVVIAESGEMSLGLGDMDIHQQITEQYVSSTDKVNYIWWEFGYPIQKQVFVV